MANSPISSLLSTALPFLRNELEKIDPSLPKLLELLNSFSANEAWHKHNTFLSHHFSVYRILTLWRCPNSIILTGFLHSAYSASPSELTLFPNSSSPLKSHIPLSIDRLIEIFCSVPRRFFIYDSLLCNYSDDELRRDLRSEAGWREKVRGIVPEDGVVMADLGSSGEIRVSRRVVGMLLVITMADYSEQQYGFYDQVFDNDDGLLQFRGNSVMTLWPGDGKPGLWTHVLSRMGAFYNLLLREEKLFIQERIRAGGLEFDPSRDEDLELVVPPVFDNCTKIVSTQDQALALDLYWEAVCIPKDETLNKAEDLLLRCIEKNPYVGEPYVVLGQVYMSKGLYEEGEKVAETGLRLLLEWGSPWDKRSSWEGWISWARVLVKCGKEKTWPNSGWGLMRLGRVE